MASKIEKKACRQYLERTKGYTILDEDNYFDFVCRDFDVIIFVDCFGWGEEIHLNRSNFERNSILWLKENKDSLSGDDLLRYDTVEADIFGDHAYIKHHVNCLGDPNE